MDPIVTSALIGGGESLLGNVFDMFGQNANNNASMDLAKYQNQWNLEQWNRQNEYNSPKATIARLVEAGINPRAYNQLGQFANAGQAQGAASAEYTSPLSKFSNVFSMFAPLVQLMQEQQKTDSVVALNSAKAEEALANRDFKLSQSGTAYEKHEYWRWINGYKTENGKTIFSTPQGYQADYNNAILEDIKRRYGLNISKDAYQKLLNDAQNRENESLFGGPTGKFLQSSSGQILNFILMYISKLMKN